MIVCICNGLKEKDIQDICDSCITKLEFTECLKMKILNKIKNLFSRKPKKKTGNIVIYFLDQKTAKIVSQEIYSISVYRDRKEMFEYLNRTVMTTMARRMKLIDFAEIENK